MWHIHKALALGEAIITVKDQSGNTLDIHVIVDYYTDNYIVSKQDIFLTGDLKDSEKQTIKEKALATIPVKQEEDTNLSIRMQK